MKKSDLLKKIENLKDNEEVNDLLKGTDIEEGFKKAGQEEGLTLDNFKTKVKSDKDFKSYIDSMNDSYHAKALKTMKEKGTWENEFSVELKSKFPDLVTDPKDKQLLEMQKKVEAMEAKEAKAELLKEALKYAGEKKLPNDFVERFLGEDLESTKGNLDGFAEQWSKAIETAVDAKFKSSSYTPPGGEGGKLSIGASLAKQQNDSKKSNIVDPWSSK